MHTLLAVWFGATTHPPTSRSATLGRYPGVAACQSGRGLTLLGLWARRLLGRGKGQSLAARAVQIAICTSYLAFGAAASILDASIGNGIATYLVCGGMGTATLSLLRPGSAPAFFGVPGVLHCGAQCPGCAARLALKHARTGPFPRC